MRAGRGIVRPAASADGVARDRRRAQRASGLNTFGGSSPASSSATPRASERKTCSFQREASPTECGVQIDARVGVEAVAGSGGSLGKTSSATADRRPPASASASTSSLSTIGPRATLTSIAPGRTRAEQALVDEPACPAVSPQCSVMTSARSSSSPRATTSASPSASASAARDRQRSPPCRGRRRAAPRAARSRRSRPPRGRRRRCRSPATRSAPSRSRLDHRAQLAQALGGGEHQRDGPSATGWLPMPGA